MRFILKRLMYFIGSLLLVLFMLVVGDDDEVRMIFSHDTIAVFHESLIQGKWPF